MTRPRISPSIDAARVAYGRALFDWIKSRRMLQTDLARLIRVSKATVTNWIDAKSSPSEKHRNALVALGFEWKEAA